MFYDEVPQLSQIIETLIIIYSYILKQYVFKNFVIAWLIDWWFTHLFIILCRVNKLFIYTHLLKCTNKHIAWYTKGKIVDIVYVLGHMHDHIIG